MGRMGFDASSFFPWEKVFPGFFPWFFPHSTCDGGRSPLSNPTCDVPFPPRRTGRYRKGMISAHPSYQVVRRSVWDPETFAPGHKSRAEARPTGCAVSRERLGDWDACVYPPASGEPHGQTESGGKVLAVNAGARAPRGGVTRQGVQLTDLQSLRDCQ